MDKENVKPGELYRHFKGNMYQIVAVAKDAETMEELVIYQALYGMYEVYARPLVEFLEVLDKKKYPYATQKYRFQFISREQRTISKEDSTPVVEAFLDRKRPIDTSKNYVKENDRNTEIEETNISQKLIMFLDANSSREKIEILQSMKKDMNEVMLSNIALSLDLVLENDDLEAGYFMILQNLEQRCRFEGSRLR